MINKVDKWSDIPRKTSGLYYRHVYPETSLCYLRYYTGNLLVQRFIEIGLIVEKNKPYSYGMLIGTDIWANYRFFWRLVYDKFKDHKDTGLVSSILSMLLAAE